ncbi:MAG: hypothetical protein RIC16_14945 [Rhodospirillales bacterium]
MSRRKRSRPSTAEDDPVEPFTDCEQAWFWFARCQRLRHAGARFDRNAGRVRRPCDPDDIYRIVMQLFRTGRLKRRHLTTLARFGALERAPDHRVPEEHRHDRDWRAALDCMSAPLIAKGIVESNDTSDRYEDSHPPLPACWR